MRKEIHENFYSKFYTIEEKCMQRGRAVQSIKKKIILSDNINMKMMQRKQGFILPSNLTIIDVKAAYITNQEKEKKMMSNDVENSDKSESDEPLDV
jgi:hypothetical protein